MNLVRILRHLLTPDFRVRRVFSREALAAIEGAIGEAEACHSGQIRFVVEPALDLGPLLHDVSARERALELFSQLRVWDTEHNNGVLVYLLYADRDVEIIADRGIHARAGFAAWERICREMEALFGEGRFEEGAVRGIQAIGEQLAHHFPGRGDANELSDSPVML